MTRSAFLGLLALGSWTLLGCQEEVPTTLDGDLLPVSPITVQVTLPFSEFVRGVSVWGGYGRPVELPHGVVARSFGGTLDARTLVGWSQYPEVASVRDTTGTVRPDTALTFVGGRIIAVFDTLTVSTDGPVELALGAPQHEWDAASVTWTMVVDTVGDQRLWPEPGGGPVLPVTTAQWDPAAGDSVIFELDSAQVAIWNDSVAARKGIRLEALTEGVRMDATAFALLLTTRPSSNPDTLVELTVLPRRRSFIYQPSPEAPGEGIWVGGVPAFRTVMEMALPDAVDLPPEICAQVSCPVTLTPEALVSASVVLHTEAPPAGFQPSDTLRLDVRQVLEPDRMPKSPLGFSLGGIFGIRIAPQKFGAEEGSEVLIPLGAYVENLIRAKTDPEVVVSEALAFLSAFEPLSLYFASFSGPGTPNEPELRLILTLGEGVQIR